MTRQLLILIVSLALTTVTAFGQKKLKGTFCGDSLFAGYCITFTNDSLFEYSFGTATSLSQGIGVYKIKKEKLILYFAINKSTPSKDESIISGEIWEYEIKKFSSNKLIVHKDDIDIDLYKVK